MKTLLWTKSAEADLRRLYAFLHPKNPPAALRIVTALTSAPEKLLTHPQRGEQLSEFSPRDIRRLYVGPYEIRYETTEQHIIILRLWHGRELRQ